MVLWTLVAVSGSPRPHGRSIWVAGVCGPMAHEIRHQDVWFNHTACFVVPPEVVAATMKQLTVVAKYPREGNLYLAEVGLSSFTRQAQAQ